MTQRVAVEAVALLESAGIDGGQVVGIGVAIAGRRGSRDQAHPSNANATDWELFALEETLGAASGRSVWGRTTPPARPSAILGGSPSRHRELRHRLVLHS